MEMPPPKTLRQLHSLQGKLQSVRHFISQLADKCHPFAHLLHKGTRFKWDCLCRKAFEKLKEYLASPPVLMPPTPRKPLILYICAIVVALGALLAQTDVQGKEHTIYYISQTLVGYELNYTPIERACLALVFSTQKL